MHLSRRIECYYNRVLSHRPCYKTSAKLKNKPTITPRFRSHLETSASISITMPSQSVGHSTEKFPKVPGTASVSCLFTWLGTKGDYASLEARSKQVTGWRRNFSSLTTRGRVNIVLATYLACAVTGYYMWNSYKTRKMEAAKLKSDE